MEKYLKYPRTPHLPWSPGATADDIRVIDTSHFIGRKVVVSTKKDGENSTCYADGKVHARSVDSNNHPSRNWIKRIIAEIKHDIPSGWRVVFENLYAEHTIRYNHLASYVELISIWDENNVCLSWDDTKDWCQLLNFTHVHVLYEGWYDEDLVMNLYSLDDEFGDPMEGYVVRVADAFPYKDFNTSVAKYVSTRFKSSLDENGDMHWLEKHKFGIVTNGLRT